uniref:RING-type domain-containing protein n=1 Tax=Alexandrium monilatum TaxID=311494 RepID=A0A7S4QQU6_9DINO
MAQAILAQASSGADQCGEGGKGRLHQCCNVVCRLSHQCRPCRMRIVAAAARRPPGIWRLPRSACCSWVLLTAQQVPVVAWLRVVIFALLIALVVVATGYLVLRLAGRLPPAPVADAAEETSARPPAGGQGQGNLLQTCGVCHQVLPMEALIPCGHMICGGCRAQVGVRCPFCRGVVEACQPVFQP